MAVALRNQCTSSPLAHLTLLYYAYDAYRDMIVFTNANCNIHNVAKDLCGNLGRQSWLGSRLSGCLFTSDTLLLFTIDPQDLALDRRAPRNGSRQMVTTAKKDRYKSRG